MRRFPFFLALTASALVLSGSALAAVVHTAATSPPTNTSLPTIGGTAREGQTLTAANGSWGGLTPITYAYDWQRCNTSGSSCASISGAKNQNYVVSKADVGRTIRVEVKATNADGTSQALSAATATIVSLASVPASTKQPSPSGTAQEGQTVTVDSGSWSGVKPITFTYQWQSCTIKVICTNVAGVTGASFLIPTSQIGSLLRATVTATNSSGATSVFSKLTLAVIAKAGPPVNLSLPLISGSTSVGQRLQASTGSWTGIGTANTFTFQWTRCSSIGAACVFISGATGQSYGIGNADRGMAIRVNVTAKNATGSTIAISSASRIAAAVVSLRFRSVLRAGQEVVRPKGTPASAIGYLTAKLTGRTLTWRLTFSHLSGRPSVTTLNRGLRGASGAAFKSLCRYCISPVHGTLVLTASQRYALVHGRVYVNIHTTRNTQGEIRGQVSRVS